MLCVLSFLRLFLTSLDLLYGDRHETRSLFCAAPHGHSVAKARGGFGKWLVRLQSPFVSGLSGVTGAPDGPHSPFAAASSGSGGSGARGSVLAHPSVATGGDGRLESVLVPLRSQLLTDSLTGAHWIVSSAPNFGFFGESVPSCRGVSCRKKGPGLVEVPIEDVEGGQKEAEK